MWLLRPKTNPALLAILLVVLFAVPGRGQDTPDALSARPGDYGWADLFNAPGAGHDRWGTAGGPQFPMFADEQRWFEFAAQGRAFYANDQRIEFSGLEATFGVEGVLRGQGGHCHGNVSGVLYGELFLNQRFDQNVLTDSRLRESFAPNFEVDTVEISQLAILVRRGNVEFELGRFVTPFGRYYGFSAQNNFFDTPFIRSEAILFRETGALLRWNPGIWRSTVAITNGGPQKDSNSSKAGIARFGIDLSRASLGTSVKWQDGIGSEGQKEFKNHVGIDGMIRLGPSILLAGEIIYDEYGIRRPGTALDDIDWGRSLYNRQLNRGLNQPLSGWGYYLQLVGQHDRLDWSLGYGQFLPQAIGDLTHDTSTSRGIGQVYWHVNSLADLYTSVVIENAIEGLNHVPRSKGVAYAAGLQVRF